MNQHNPNHSPVPVSEHVALAVISSEMKHIKEAVDRIEASVGKSVPRESWEARNTHVDSKFIEVQKDIVELWAEIKSKKVPWTSTAAFIVAAAVLLFDLIPRLAN